MAARFRENDPEIPTPAGEEIQEEGQVKVGETALDEGRQDCTIELYYLWVDGCLVLRIQR